MSVNTQTGGPEQRRCSPHSGLGRGSGNPNDRMCRREASSMIEQMKNIHNAYKPA